MRLARPLGLFALVLAPFAVCQADVSVTPVESTWFSTEQEALYALSEGRELPVIECNGCDADDPTHRTTAETLRQILGEFQANGLPDAGALVLRERVPARFIQNAALLQVERSACSPRGWSPSLTLWRYDLPRGKVEPSYTACVPFLDRLESLRLSCADCDLELLEPIELLKDSLIQSLGPGAVRVDTLQVRSGELLVTDPTDRGFRRIDFRAYGTRVYLGPEQGQTQLVTLDPDPTRSLAGTAMEAQSP